MKNGYSKPFAEKLMFDYTVNVHASTGATHHGDVGIGLGNGGGCDHEPGHGDPHKPHPGKP